MLEVIAIRLTDLTLRCIDTAHAPAEALREFYMLLLTTGVNLVEVDETAAGRLGDALDPARTVLHVRRISDARPGFVRCCCRMTDAPTPLPLLQEIRVNDAREINLLSRYAHCTGVRVVGLDDLMLADFTRIFHQLQHTLPPSMELCPKNACGCASALLIEWLLQTGGNGACAFCGAEGFAATEEVLLALRLGSKYRKKSDLAVLPRLRELYETLTGAAVCPHKAVLGRDIFAVESGVHVDGILKNAAIYEPYPPETVGLTRRIVIGKHAGKNSLAYVLEKCGKAPNTAHMDALLYAVRRQSAKLHRALTAGELLALAEAEGAI